MMLPHGTTMIISNLTATLIQDWMLKVIKSIDSQIHHNLFPNKNIDQTNQMMLLHGTTMTISNLIVTPIPDWLLKVIRSIDSLIHLSLFLKLKKTKTKNIDQLEELLHGIMIMDISNHITDLQIEAIQIG